MSKKQDFILAQPLTMKASEVVQRAAKAGLHIKPQYVYATRSLAAGASVGKPRPVVQPPQQGVTAERFLENVFELGLTDAEALLAQARRIAQHTLGSAR